MRTVFLFLLLPLTAFTLTAQTPGHLPTGPPGWTANHKILHHNTSSSLSLDDRTAYPNRLSAIQRANADQVLVSGVWLIREAAINQTMVDLRLERPRWTPGEKLETWGLRWNF